MKGKYSEEKIVQILNEVAAGSKVLDTCRKYGISDATYYNWKAKYGGMGVSDVRRLKELENENQKLRTSGRRSSAGYSGIKRPSKKLLKPEVRREAVKRLMDFFGLSERRACRLAQINRSSYRYESHTRDDLELRERIKYLAFRHKRYGTPRIFNKISQEHWGVNHKKVERIYREEELSLRKKRRKKLRSEAREKPEPPSAPNKQWAMDFTADRIAGGRRFRTLNVLDIFHREALAIYVDTSIPGSVVSQVLERIGDRQGFPDQIICDNGPEFTSLVLDKWCYAHGVQLSFITPGKPTENGFVESFNGKFRDECLDMNWFTSLDQARRVIEQWRIEYNEIRPHSSLKGISPLEFLKQFEESRNTAEPLFAGG